MKNVLHLLVSGGIGGIEVLMKNYAQHSVHRNFFLFLWGSGEIAEAMERDGGRIFIADAGRERIDITLKKIRQICMQEKIDVVVSHNSAPLLKLALIYLKFSFPNVSTVAYAHANAKDICDNTRKKGLLMRKIVHYMGFRFSNGVIAISESVKSSLQDYLKVNSNKIEKIYNGTPLVTEAHAVAEYKENSNLKWIYVGRLIYEKGVQNTLEALARLKDEVSFSFTIVGDGSYRNELERLIAELDLCDRVQIVGFRRDVSDLLRDSDVFIHLPVWEEGFGITVIEAMAAGKLCVVNSRGALPEIIEHNVNGFVVDVNDSEMLDSTLKRIASLSHTDRERLCCCATKRAQTFSIESFAEKLDCYLQAIE